MTARVFLGIFEAGFGPAIPLYFCRWRFILVYPYISDPYFWTALFYTKSEMGMRVSIFPTPSHASAHSLSQMAYWFGFAAVAGAFGGLIAFGIQHIDASIQNWRLLFIIEVSSIHDTKISAFLMVVQGTPAILLGIMTLFLLPNRPESTTYLTERERAIALDRMNRSTSGDTGAVVNRGMYRHIIFKWRETDYSKSPYIFSL